MADPLNFQLPRDGFDSYLYGIIPDDQAVVAGAFNVSMRQIKNIDKINQQQFAKVVYSIETNNGLPLTDGTNVPTATFIADSALSKVALGSGIYGTYTHSDFIGSMTALPYPLQNIYDGIKELQTQNLENIYKQIWNITTYGQATATVTYETYTDSVSFITYYTITGITIDMPGGGYTSVPSFTINGGSGASAIIEVGTDSENPATYKRISKITLTSSGTDTSTVPSITIDPPPNDAYGSVSDPNAWTNRNNALATLIDQANNEIQSIAISEQNFAKAKLLNANWNQLGTALKIEHRARYTAIPPVPIPRDPFIALYPTALYNFVDSIPDYAANTMPHGPAQSLEMMSNLCNIGGQSLIAMMRQERNQLRLSEIGIPLDNNIPNTISDYDKKQLMANGTRCGATKEEIDEDGNSLPGAGIDADNGLSFTVPAFPNSTDCDGQLVKPEKDTFFDNADESLRKVAATRPGSIEPLLTDPSCAPGPGLYDPNAGTTVAGPEIPIEFSILLPTGIPNILSDIVGGDTGNVLPDALNRDFTSGILLPSQYNLGDAIDRVVECNCDCWIQ